MEIFWSPEQKKTSPDNSCHIQHQTGHTIYYNACRISQLCLSFRKHTQCVQTDRHTDGHAHKQPITHTLLHTNTFATRQTRIHCILNFETIIETKSCDTIFFYHKWLSWPHHNPFAEISVKFCI